MVLRTSKVQRGGIFAILCLWVSVNLFLLMIMFLSGFKSANEIFTNPFGLPEKWNLTSYIAAWKDANFGDYFLNSLIVTGISILLIIIISSMGAYVLARYEFPGRRLVFLYILAGLALPIRLAVIPLFVMIRSLNLQDTLIALFLSYTAGGLSFSTFLLTNFFRSIPLELEESARIEGAGYFRLYWAINLPLIRPALATIAVFNFNRIWNDFFFALIFISSESKKTIPLGIQNFFGEYTVRWDMLFAGLNIAVIPVIIFFIILSRQFIGGLVEGAVK